MSGNSAKALLIVLTQEEARIWHEPLDKGKTPEIIQTLFDKTSMAHQRMTEHQSGHSEDPVTWGYFDVIAKKLNSERPILLMGHGHGSSNVAQRFEKFVGENFKEVANNIVGNLDVNLNAISENEMLATAREWFDNYQRTGLKLSK